MKTNLLLALCIILTINCFSQIGKSDYKKGYFITSDSPVSRKVKPNQKVECYIDKNVNYTYLTGDDYGVNVFYKMTEDGKKEKIWWADIKEIYVDTILYRSFEYKNWVGNGETAVVKRLFQGKKLDYFDYGFIVNKDGTYIKEPAAELPNSFDVIKMKKYEKDMKIFKDFLLDYFKDCKELVDKIKSEEIYVKEKIPREFFYKNKTLHKCVMIYDACSN